ncbi:uncharacterized protein F4817DRAFT_305437 [Daldinia loculata]|uniref:uncharacterized protein n=1 Tax=Daldinia loculata TaxID=103429 RepID=UPI0020C3761E|nr:uncharacterized protein F4817DRAFT_305437 [Daldinia loculata]KAI1642368.1 hypothetical protein F4817DRAFT_305437 [Daldinia loculata]
MLRRILYLLPMLPTQLSIDTNQRRNAANRISVSCDSSAPPTTTRFGQTRSDLANTLNAQYSYTRMPRRLLSLSF